MKKMFDSPGQVTADDYFWCAMFSWILIQVIYLPLIFTLGTEGNGKKTIGISKWKSILQSVFLHTSDIAEKSFMTKSLRPGSC